MTDREKLGKLLAESASIAAYKRGGEWEYSLNYEEIVDHLLANGVTVKEMQKPMAIEELKILGVYWLEERGDKLECFEWRGLCKEDGGKDAKDS